MFCCCNKKNAIIFPAKWYIINRAKNISILNSTETSINKLGGQANIIFIIVRNITFDKIWPWFVLSNNDYFGWYNRLLILHFSDHINNFSIRKYTQFTIKFCNNGRSSAKIHNSNFSLVMPCENISR